MDSSLRHVHPGPGDGDGEDMGSDCSMAGMMMTFHFGHCETVLFDGWQITDVGSLVGSVIGIIILAALYEGLKYFREFLLIRKNQQAIHNSATDTHETESTNIMKAMFSPTHGIQTLLHIVQIILSYFLMLIFMTYNGWLCIAVVVGAAIGYFLVGWKKSTVVDITEHCH